MVKFIYKKTHQLIETDVAVKIARWRKNPDFMEIDKDGKEVIRVPRTRKPNVPKEITEE